MGDLTKNLSRHEFACECGCGFDTVDTELLPALQHGVDYFENRVSADIWIEITGPNRCYQHNIDEGGAEDSMHVLARAVDFKLWKTFINRGGKRTKGEQISPERVFAFYDDNYHHFGIGRYKNRTHVDNRTNGPARWVVK